jgi:hypothetical protein
MENRKGKPKNVKKGARGRKGFGYPEKPEHDRIRKTNVSDGQNQCYWTSYILSRL